MLPFGSHSPSGVLMQKMREPRHILNSIHPRRKEGREVSTDPSKSGQKWTSDVHHYDTLVHRPSQKEIVPNQSNEV